MAGTLRGQSVTPSLPRRLASTDASTIVPSHSHGRGIGQAAIFLEKTSIVTGKSASEIPAISTLSLTG